MQKDTVTLILVILIALAAAFALHYTFEPTPCATYACFEDHMASCSRASYTNEEPEASWEYTIMRHAHDVCEIRVTLLQAKEGDLQLRSFEGHTMVCAYPFGVIAYPDKDMSVCHGRLKEDLQGLIIEKLHRYVVDHLTDIKSVLYNNTNSSA